MDNSDEHGHFVYPELGTISNTTHDTSTSRYHIKLSAWLQQLDISVEAAWSAQPVTYSKTAVLMLSWKDTDISHASTEFIRLRNVFQEMFKYHVEQWEIPSVDPDLETLDTIQRFIRQHGSRNALLIVYYAGHARPGSPRGAPPIWRARSKPEEGQEFNTASIQTLLARAQATSPDISLLSDCCNSLFAHPSNDKPSRAVVECLFARGFEAQVPIAGPDSFTSALIEELAEAADSQQPLSVIELHSKIIRRLQSSYVRRVVFNSDGTPRRSTKGDVVFTKDTRITPSHVFLSVNKPPRSIHLAPARSELSGSRKDLLKGKTNASVSQVWPKVILAIRLEEEEDVPDQLRQWLSAAPPGVVDLVGIYTSFSTLLLMEIPVVIWNLLPFCAAVSYIGFSIGSLQMPPTAEPPLYTSRSHMLDSSKLQSRYAAFDAILNAASRWDLASDPDLFFGEYAVDNGVALIGQLLQQIESQSRYLKSGEVLSEVSHPLRNSGFGSLLRACADRGRRLVRGFIKPERRLQEILESVHSNARLVQEALESAKEHLEEYQKRCTAYEQHLSDAWEKRREVQAKWLAERDYDLAVPQARWQIERSNQDIWAKSADFNSDREDYRDRLRAQHDQNEEFQARSKQKQSEEKKLKIDDIMIGETSRPDSTLAI